MNDRDTRILNVQLANGDIIKAEVSLAGGERDVRSNNTYAFEDFAKKLDSIIGGIAGEIKQVLEVTAPKKVGIEFGIEISLESGQLTAMLVKGTGTTSFKVTVEW